MFPSIVCSVSANFYKESWGVFLFFQRRTGCAAEPQLVKLSLDPRSEACSCNFPQVYFCSTLLVQHSTSFARTKHRIEVCIFCESDYVLCSMQSIWLEMGLGSRQLFVALTGISFSVADMFAERNANNCRMKSLGRGPIIGPKAKKSGGSLVSSWQCCGDWVTQYQSVFDKHFLIVPFDFISAKLHFRRVESVSAYEWDDYSRNEVRATVSERVPEGTNLQFEFLGLNQDECWCVDIHPQSSKTEMTSLD